MFNHCLTQFISYIINTVAFVTSQFIFWRLIGDLFDIKGHYFIFIQGIFDRC